ncbi:biotin carboxylase [Lipingzhangella halophila]|uniref:Biotin carboxylase n=1 Tax=Lipingzhangella halophila TaxID=1783352 RepID=A0A7W7RP18_9ACTN|nr:ATP-grasp domain-containing protein [Lipingzhangella halophila]MBB4935033.1 biotin carboxylase [Lipingzhangella halophila]
MRENIFVLGLDQINLETLQSLPHLAHYRFHTLLDVDELVGTEEIPLPELLDKAREQLRSFDGTVDAIIGYWDFPVSSMVPLLCAEFGLRSAPLDAVVRCEHKYWSRLTQAEVIDEYPSFGLVRLDEEPSPPEGVGFPMWLKPVKSSSSELAFLVENEEQFDSAARRISGGIDRVGAPFNFVLSHVDLPPEVAAAGGRSCLAEEAAEGMQITVEGYSADGHARVYGVVDAHTYADSPSFLRYQHPTSLPDTVVERLSSISTRVARRMGLDSTTFNIEFFWNPTTGAISLLEINPRHSQSHALLFEMVDGLPNHQIMVDLALGRPPDVPHREGPYDVAAAWFLRRFADGMVRHVPTSEEIARVERTIPGVRVQVEVREGQRLSEKHGQDSYSYELARVYVGADDEAGMREKYAACVEELPFEFD